MDQILAGLDRLHAAGIIHRDIKPYNILLTDDDRVKIIDLGLSRLRGEVKSFPDSFKIGTPFYAAPEQAMIPEQADERADLYSAGIMAWRLLTGALPSEDGSPTPPSAQNPMLGNAWDEILCKGIDPDPEKRFQTCMQMRESLRNAVEEWQKKVAQACQWVPAGAVRTERGGLQKLRKTPAKISKTKALEAFGIDDLYRPTGNAGGNFQICDFETVRDENHGLIWQRSGSSYPLDWYAAHEFISRLNLENYGGIGQWRIPTVNELICLIRPKTALGDYCQPEVFDNRKNRLWSSDKKSFTAAWYVHTDMGYVGGQDMTCRFYVRAVSDA
jgi:serine/threonine-protein kinase